MTEATAPAAKLAFTIQETIAATGIGRTALFQEIREGKLIARKRGSQTLILAEDLRAYLANLPAAGKDTVQ